MSWHTRNRRGAHCAPVQRQIKRFVGEQCSPLRDDLCKPDTSGAPSRRTLRYNEFLTIYPSNQLQTYNRRAHCAPTQSETVIFFPICTLRIILHSAARKQKKKGRRKLLPFCTKIHLTFCEKSWYNKTLYKIGCIIRFLSIC